MIWPMPISISKVLDSFSDHWSDNQA